MRATSFPEYAHAIQEILDSLIATGEVTLTTLQIDQRSSLRGHIAGVLRFEDSSELHFRLFVDTSRTSPRLMYAYHYQAIDKALIFRYDNAAHRPKLPQPEHKHTPSGVETSHAPRLEQVIALILKG